MNYSELVLGVDGGGTKTMAWIGTAEGSIADEPLGTGQSGPGNPRAVGFETALANLGEAVDRAFAAAGMASGRVAAACLALAGADRSEERQRMEAWASGRQLAEKLRVTNDAEPILACGDDEGWGIALISGTGSLAYGRDRSGKTARCGGWGYLFGDEGSGYAIGLAALRAAARAADGRDEPRELFGRVLDHFQLTTASELISTIYNPNFPRRRIAELADLVIQSAPRDVAARRIVEQAGEDLAELVGTLVGKLSLSSGDYPLAMSGGILVNQLPLRDQVLRQLTEREQLPRSITLVPDPVRGAVHLARGL